MKTDSLQMVRRGLLILLGILLPWAVAAQQITVSAAASLSDAFKEIGARFEASVPGATVRFNIAASGILLQQIVQGAPVDVYASADQETMNRGAGQKLFEDASRRDFASNRLVLVEPLQGGTGLRGLDDLARPAVKRIAVGKPLTVPAGRYTREVLDDAGLWETLAPKFVFADSVRQVLDYVGRGEVEAGFVYQTDAVLMRDRIRVVAAPNIRTPVSYPAAVVRDSRQKELARRFVDFLLTEPARQVFDRYGFGSPGG